MVGGGVFIWLIYGSFFYRVSPEAIVRYEGTLLEKPTIKRTTGKNRKNYLRLRVNERPDLNFDLYDAAYRACNTPALIGNNKPGDSIVVWVDREDFIKYYLSVDLELPSNVKSPTTSHIEVYQVGKPDGTLYLESRHYVSAHRRERRICLLFFIPLVLYLCWGIRKSDSDPPKGSLF